MLVSVTFYVGMREVWMLQGSVSVKGCVEEEGSIPLRLSSTCVGDALCARVSVDCAIVPLSSRMQCG